MIVIFHQFTADVLTAEAAHFIGVLHSQQRSNHQLRKMLNIGGEKDRPGADVSRLSDAELIQQLADTAKELGIEINLNYSFLQRNRPTRSHKANRTVARIGYG